MEFKRRGMRLMNGSFAMSLCINETVESESESDSGKSIKF